MAEVTAPVKITLMGVEAVDAPMAEVAAPVKIALKQMGVTIKTAVGLVEAQVEVMAMFPFDGQIPLLRHYSVGWFCSRERLR